MVVTPKPDKAIHPDKIDTMKTCKVCGTPYSKELEFCPVCRKGDGPKSGYYLS